MVFLPQLPILKGFSFYLNSYREGLRKSHKKGLAIEILNCIEASGSLQSLLYFRILWRRSFLVNLVEDYT